MVYEYNGVVVRVVDGDSVHIECDLGFGISFREKFRLLGINTSEIYGVKKDSDEYLKGMISTNWLTERVLGKEVVIRTKKDRKGKYGRYLAEIFIDGVNINQEMITLELADPYP